MASSTSQQNFTGSSFSAARAGVTRHRVEFHPAEPTRPPVQAAAPIPGEYRILFQMADVTGQAVRSDLRRDRSMGLEAALETLGSVGAPSSQHAAEVPVSQVTKVNSPGAEPPIQAESPSAVRAYASLLAASPAYPASHSIKASEPFVATRPETVETPFAVETPVTKRQVPESHLSGQFETASSLMDDSVPSASSKGISSRGTPSAKPEPAEDSAPLPVHRDRIPVKPVRRPFRVYRPAWLPEVPPSLLLGLLICFSALLVGMLWRGHRSESAAPLEPAGVANQTDPASEQPENPATPRVAEVPPLPAKTAQKSSDKKKTASKSKPAAPAAKAPAQVAESKPAESKPVEVVAKPTLEQELAAQKAPEVQALPVVETAPATPAPVYGQMPGGPPPHYVENPHANGTGPIYQARRPAAEFQGTITKPDATQAYERY